jgi:hypothetical protein
MARVLVKRPEREADHLPTSSTEARNDGAIYPDGVVSNQAQAQAQAQVRLPNSTQGPLVHVSRQRSVGTLIATIIS